MTDTLYIEGSGNVEAPTLDEWLRDILPHTPGAERKVVQRELQMAAREFYERSASWRAVIGPIDIEAGEERVWLSPKDQFTDVIRILGATFNGFHLRRLPNAPMETPGAGDRPWGWYAEAPDILGLTPVPETDYPGSLRVFAALVPKRNVKSLPRLAATHHYDAILDGALGRLLSHPAKPYTNLQLATYRLNRFRSAIGAYAGDAKQGYSNSPNWRFPRHGV